MRLNNYFIFKRLISVKFGININSFSTVHKQVNGPYKLEQAAGNEDHICNKDNLPKLSKFILNFMLSMIYADF